MEKPEVKIPTPVHYVLFNLARGGAHSPADIAFAWNALGILWTKTKGIT